MHAMTTKELVEIVNMKDVGPATKLIVYRELMIRSQAAAR